MACRVDVPVEPFDVGLRGMASAAFSSREVCPHHATAGQEGEVAEVSGS